MFIYIYIYIKLKYINSDNPDFFIFIVLGYLLDGPILPRIANMCGF